MCDERGEKARTKSENMPLDKGELLRDRNPACFPGPRDENAKFSHR